MTRSALIAAAIVLGSVGFLAGRLSSSASVAPSTSSTSNAAGGFEPSQIDLGKLPWHSSARFETRFHAPGEESVSISAVKSGCDCTVVDSQSLIGRKLARGDSVELSGRVETRTRLGQRSVEISLLLSNGTVHVLVVSYQGYPTYTVTPDRLLFERVNIDESETELNEAATASAVFRAVEGATVLGVESDSAWLLATALPREDGAVEIVAHVDRRLLPHGRSDGRLTIETSDEKQAAAYVYVSANGESRFRAVPGHVFLRGAGQQPVSLYDKEGRRLEIDRYELEPAESGIHVEFDTSRPTRFVVRADDETPGNVRDSQLRLWTKDGEFTRVWVTRMTTKE